MTILRIALRYWQCKKVGIESSNGGVMIGKNAGLSIALLCIGAGVSLSACSPDNTERSGLNQFHPKPGYVWASSDTSSTAVVWKAGQTHPDFPNIVSSATEGQWVPNYGYDWASPDVNSKAVVWKAGLRYDNLPHVSSSATVGQWIADAGYQFADTTTLRTVWAPGTTDPNRNHYIAAATEGSWTLEPGYSEQYDNMGAYAAWTPGLANAQYAGVVAASAEGSWVPAPGYAFASSTGLATVAVGYNSGSDTTQRFVGGLAKAVVGGIFSESQPDDGMLASLVGRPLARAVVESGVNDMSGAMSNSH